jgi:hypothetical protein
VNSSQALSPRLLDAVRERVGFGVRYTPKPKPDDAPDNLFGPIAGHNTSEDCFSDQAHPRRLYNWLELGPAGKRAALMGTALGTLAIWRAR